MKLEIKRQKGEKKKSGREVLTASDVADEPSATKLSTVMRKESREHTD